VGTNIDQGYVLVLHDLLFGPVHLYSVPGIDTQVPLSFRRRESGVLHHAGAWYWARDKECGIAVVGTWSDDRVGPLALLAEM
jgi:hypothetical protein